LRLLHLVRAIDELALTRFVRRNLRTLLHAVSLSKVLLDLPATGLDAAR